MARACSACGKGIAPARLEAIPDAVRCVECQRGREAAGEGGRVEWADLVARGVAAEPDQEDLVRMMERLW
jgi:hypothetical protein